MTAEANGPSLAVRVRRDGPFPLDVAFDAPPGVTVLFGPSGAGKTTTLSTIAGLLRPSSGTIALGGEPWFDSSSKIDVAPRDRRLALVFQSLALFPHLTAIDNVSYGMPRSVPARDRRDQALVLLNRLRAAHVAARRPATFSGGEARRVALARALASCPRVVLLDEPFASLDGQLRRELVDDFRRSLRELSVPVILVTHDRWEARQLGQRVILLENGRVQRDASIQELPDEETTPAPALPEKTT
jgi:molybdate transport system ATP-binding protein